MKKMSWLLFGLLGAAYFYCSMLRISAVVVLPPLGISLGLNAAMIGFLSSLFFYTYGGAQGLWGTLCDRIGPLRACSAGLLIAAIGTSLFPQAHTPLLIGISRILTGLGIASIFSGILLYAALAFPPEKYSFYAALVLTTGNLGTVAAVAPLGLALRHLGIPGVFILFTFFSLGLSLILFLLRRYEPSPPKNTLPPLSPKAVFKELTGGVRFIAASRPLLTVTLIWATLSASVMTLQGLWGSSWLEASHRIPAQEAHTWVTWISVGLVLGSLAGGKITALARNSLRVLGWNCLALQTGWLLYWLGAATKLPLFFLGGFGFLIGTFSGIGMVYCSSTVRKLSDPSRVGTTLGTANTIIFLTVILFQWTSGILLNTFPDHTPNRYANAGYLISFAPILIVQGASFIPALLSGKNPRKRACVTK